MQPWTTHLSFLGFKVVANNEVITKLLLGMIWKNFKSSYLQTSQGLITEKAMATHSSILAWKIPWREEPGRLQSMGSLGVGHDWATFTFHFHALEKEMATHSSVLAWRIPGTGEPCGLPSVGSHRVGHDWRDLAAAVGAIIIPILSLRK